MSKVYWSRELTLSLIELYHQHQCFGDVRSDVNRESDARIASVVQITREFNETDTNMKQEDLKQQNSTFKLASKRNA